MVGVVFDDPPVFYQGQVGEEIWLGRVIGPHIIAVRQAKILIEPVPGRKKFGMMPQVPLAIAGSRVTERLEHFGNRHFLAAYPNLGPGVEHLRQTHTL